VHNSKHTHNGFPRNENVFYRDEALCVEINDELLKFEVGAMKDEWNAAIELDIQTLTRQQRVCDKKRKKTERKIAECTVHMGSLRKELSTLEKQLEELVPWQSIFEKKSRELLVLYTKSERINHERRVKNDFTRINHDI
jgi:hypothetical protein